MRKGPDCTVRGLKNLCVTFMRCGKCCSRVECVKHPLGNDAAGSAEDGKSIACRRKDARKADAVKAVESAEAKLAKERKRAVVAGVVVR